LQPWANFWVKRLNGVVGRALDIMGKCEICLLYSQDTMCLFLRHNLGLFSNEVKTMQKEPI
jgi:hypothetical protein